MKTIVIFFLLSVGGLGAVLSGPEKQDKIRGRLEQLRETLLARKSPSFLLPPSMSEQIRAQQSSSVMRPYVVLQFEYNLADVRWKGDDAAELPLRVNWKTAKVEGSLSGTAQFVRVGDEWYFGSFDFLLFPWREVVLASLLAVAFTVAIFVLFRRLRGRGVGSAKALPVSM
jgi:hypothetical protein